MEDHILTLLNGHLDSDATRLAEIYHAESNSEESLYLLALSYFRSRRLSSVYQILSRATFSQAKTILLFGQCCYELGKYHEAEKSLLNNDNSFQNGNKMNTNAIITSTLVSSTATLACNTSIRDQLVELYGNDSAAAIAAKYLGLIFEKTSRSSEAIEFFRISLDLFPYMWGSAEALARLNDKNSNYNTRTSFLANSFAKFKPTTDHSSKQSDHIMVSHQLNHNNHQYHLATSVTATATANSMHHGVVATPLTNNHESDYKTPKAPPQIKKEPRRSTRLYSIENNNETPATRPTIAGINAPAKKMRRLANAEPEPTLDSTAKIFLECYKGLDCLNQYKLDQAVTILSGLPEKHRNTGWVLSCIGRALYEKTNYAESVKYYESARRLEPYRLEGMEYYSSALWHLHKEVELSVLAKELMEFDQNAPETWCVAGNCYSLQKEHESAIKYLEKAIKLDPNFAYAYTLLGHELISAERLDQAMTYFRNAVRLDPRHWNAWCGLGCIYYKNELYTNAELYYLKALKIAPTNPVLMCQLAVVQHVCKKSDAAIETLTKAIDLDPDNALCRFHRATIYSAIDRNKEALFELDQLKHLVPKESMVYFLIGKIHKKLGNSHTALMNFSWAMELDPKGVNNTIRELIDKQHSGEEDVIVHRD